LGKAQIGSGNELVIAHGPKGDALRQNLQAPLHDPFELGLGVSEANEVDDVLRARRAIAQLEVMGAPHAG